MEPLPQAALPAGITASHVTTSTGLRMHLLQAGDPADPALLLLHGFPELAYSWRKVMPALAAAGYYVLAPDQRGYGRTIGWDVDNLGSFRFLNLVRDAMGLLRALGIDRVAAIVGHDFGASVAGWAALLRPDIFQRLVLMSAPFAGAPTGGAAPDFHAALAALPRPRKHYQGYYSTPNANADMIGAPQGLHAFLRAYYHHKSADWPGNRPFPLTGWTADELAKLPTYYVMDRDAGMPASVVMPGTIPAWLPDAELAIYTEEFARIGFQGGLNWYRLRTTPGFSSELEVFTGLQIPVPTGFIAGAQDWGIHQSPGALVAMEHRACADFRGMHLIEGAGHWVQQEQPAAVVAHLLRFLRG
jgi:pimeloyl-ACP methyl ester carboxylesterase